MRHNQVNINTTLRGMKRQSNLLIMSRLLHSFFVRNDVKINLHEYLAAAFAIVGAE